MAQRPPDAPGSIQQRKYRSALVAIALLCVVALVISALYELHRSRREVQERAANEIDVLARVFAEQTRRSLQTVDIMLKKLQDVTAAQVQAAPTFPSQQELNWMDRASQNDGVGGN